MKKLLLVDGNSLVNRAFFALPSLTNSAGIPTGAVHGFLTMLFSILRTGGHDHLIVAFDAKAKTFRHTQYPEYKGTRKGMPEELAVQMPVLKEILDALGIHHLEKKGYEADDLIGTLAKRGKEEGYSSLILTGDKDLLQLVEEGVQVAIPKKGVSDLRIYDAKAVEEDWGVLPEQVIDYKGLRGDTSDNIPGVKGIGEKGARKLLAEGRHLEDVYAELSDKPKNRTEKLLLEGREMAFLSRELATILCEVPMETFPLENCSLSSMEPSSALPLLEKYELRSFLRELAKNYDTTLAEEPQAPEADLLSAVPAISFVEGDFGVFYVLYDGESEVFTDLGIFLERIASYKRLAIYDAKSLLLHALEENMYIQPQLEDVMLLHYLAHPLVSANDPSNLFAPVLREVGDWKALLKDASRAQELAVHLAKGASLLTPSLLLEIEELGVDTLYHEVEMPLVPVLAQMQSDGFCVDKQALSEIGEEIDATIASLVESIHAAAGRSFNIASTKQLGEVLFEELLLPVVKRTKSGYSTDKEVLDKLRGRHPIIEDILAYRMYTKLKGTYIDGLLRVIREGKIHSNLQQTIAVTGRLSSNDPNLQNIPIRLEEGRRLRKAFLPSQGNLLLSADYNQIELRVLAHISGDAALRQAFVEGEDIHAQSAALVFGVPREEVTSQQRREAKAVNFGIVYGISDFGLSENISIPLEQARDYKERYFAHYPDVKRYMEEIVLSCREKGYVTTLLGRIRPIPDIQARNFNLRSFAERTAINSPIQGSAADIIKLAMLRVDEKLREEKLSAKLILQVHDELILDVPREEVERVKVLVREAMEGATELSVPLEVSMDVGESWYDI